MLFNSIDFAIFFPTVFILYWTLFKDNIKFQNLLIILSSYIFYGFWDWRFLGLIFFSTCVDFLIGAGLTSSKNDSRRKLLLGLSIIVNLGLLAFFKYYNFFIENFISAFTFFGKDISVSSLSIILPVGISFYTFQTISYSIDIYRRKLLPTSDFIAFSAFVSFFPQLVAGPIERATNLLPQFLKKRKFNYKEAVIGLRQILWGLFKKVVIADNCAEYANLIFNNYDQYTGSTLILGAIFFTFQIYCDFSGYSDMAIGMSRLLGFKLMINFAYPYFSRDIAEFWRRWHISLSTWFRDYLYIPLGGSRGSKILNVRNVLIVFIISGFWHGANWTFIVWGGLNGLFFLPLLLLGRNRDFVGDISPDSHLPSLKEFLNILITFCITVLAWIFFRAENISHAFGYIQGLFSASIIEFPIFPNMIDALLTLVLVLFMLVIEWLGRNEEFPIINFQKKVNKPFRYLFYYTILFFILFFGGSQQEFIYFQF